MWAANCVLLCAVAAALAATTAATYLRPDPLQVVVTTLENFVTNLTAQQDLLQHNIAATLANHTATLLRLAEFLTAESTRGERLRQCLADPSQC